MNPDNVIPLNSEFKSSRPDTANEDYVGPHGTDEINTDEIVYYQIKDSDIESEKGATMAMSDGVSRNEMEAKLEAIEARMDTRVQHIEMMVEKSMESIQRVEKGLGKHEEKVESRIAGQKKWAIGIALTLFIAIFGVFQFVISNSTSWMQHSITRIEQSVERLEKVKSSPDSSPQVIPKKAPVE